MTDQFVCPLCGAAPMQLLGNPHGEQYYRCGKNRCYGSRDVDGASYREEPFNSGARRRKKYGPARKEHTIHWPGGFKSTTARMPKGNSPMKKLKGVKARRSVMKKAPPKRQRKSWGRLR